MQQSVLAYSKLVKTKQNNLQEKNVNNCSHSIPELNSTQAQKEHERQTKHKCMYLVLKKKESYSKEFKMRTKYFLENGNMLHVCVVHKVAFLHIILVKI